MRKVGTWTTRDNVKLEIAWMDSVHLAHSCNLVLSRSPFRVAFTSPIFAEAFSRLLVPKDYDGTPLVVPTRRETPDEMCMLNAILEVDPLRLRAWKSNTEKFTEACPKKYPKLFAKLFAKYVELKLTR